MWRTIARSISCSLAILFAALVATYWEIPRAVAAEGAIEELLVTAQRREETIQDVPISVTAFDADALDKYQIDTFSDLQFNVPNVSYTKTNFTGNNFQIRGIGNTLIATSSDSGVGMHVNDVYINNPRIFETEYYDMAQVEILRGPQGTLFGRNATGGVVNLKTRRPDIGEFATDIEAQVGNFDHRKIKGAVNIPLGDTMAARIAGIYLDRSGYTDDIISGDDVDGREQWSIRGSLRWEPTETTTVDLIAHYYDEDSDRSRSQKQLCNQDPSAILGCLPTGFGFEPVNPFATAGILLSSDLIVGPLGVYSFFGGGLGLDPTVGNPPDLREVALNTKPQYESDETFVMLEWTQGLGTSMEMTLLVSYQETEVFTRQDFNGTAPVDTNITLPLGFCGFAPAACTLFGTQDGGPLWTSSIDDPLVSLGAIEGGDAVTLSNLGGANDISRTDAEQWSAELRFASALDGPVNFMIAGYYLDYETKTNYTIKGPTLDYPSLVLGHGALGLAGSPNLIGTLAAPVFDNAVDPFTLESYAAFGELYWEASDTVKLTLGLRWTKDEKFVRDRQSFLDFPIVTDITSGAHLVAGAIPVSNVNEAVAAATQLGLFDADPNLAGGQEWREQSVEFDELTGRFVVDWAPDLDWSDDTLVYFSYSRGYKSGGANPPIDTTLFPNTPTDFKPEDINAFEIGTKNTFWDRRAQVNLSAFYYDYGGLQISKIANRTSINENTDAEVFGMEAEFILSPTENWLFNAQISYLNTELKDTETADPRDPTQGRQDVSLFGDFPQASNCVLIQNGLGPVSDNPLFVATVQSLGAPYFPTGRDLGAFGGPPGAVIPATPGVSDSAITSCAALEALAPLLGYTFDGSGIPTQLEGNELQNSPEWSISLGAQYTWFLNNGWSLTARADYYWQDEFFASTFNRPQDQFDSWDVINLQATLGGENWYVRGFVQNVENDDNLTGAYVTGPGSGLFTNVFLNEPRLYGLTLGVNM